MHYEDHPFNLHRFINLFNSGSFRENDESSIIEFEYNFKYPFRSNYIAIQLGMGKSGELLLKIKSQILLGNDKDDFDDRFFNEQRLTNLFGALSKFKNEDEESSKYQIFSGVNRESGATVVITEHDSRAYLIDLGYQSIEKELDLMEKSSSYDQNIGKINIYAILSVENSDPKVMISDLDDIEVYLNEIRELKNIVIRSYSV